LHGNVHEKQNPKSQAPNAKQIPNSNTQIPNKESRAGARSCRDSSKFRVQLHNFLSHARLSRFAGLRSSSQRHRERQELFGLIGFIGVISSRCRVQSSKLKTLPPTSTLLPSASCLYPQTSNLLPPTLCGSAGSSEAGERYPFSLYLYFLLLTAHCLLPMSTDTVGSVHSPPTWKPLNNSF